MTLTIPDTTEKSVTDAMRQIPCEGNHHRLGINGHVIGQPAAVGVDTRCPSCGMDARTLLLCRGRWCHWQREMEAGEEIGCEACGKASPLADWFTNMIPLDGESGRRSDDLAQPASPECAPSSPGTEPAAAIPSMDWQTALTAFGLFERAKGLSERTIANRAAVLGAMGRAVAQEPTTVRVEHLREHLTRGIVRSSIQTETDTFRAFFRFMLENGHRADDPSLLLPTVRAPKRKPRPYSPEQIEALLSGTRHRATRAMILLAFYQGFRASEVAAVHGHDFDLDADTIRVVGKAGKHSTLPLHPEIRALVATMPADDWWFPARRGAPGHIRSNSVSDLMKRAKQRAGITNERLTGHSLRHSYGTELVRAGVDLRTVQELMRHETLQTTELYTEINDAQMRAGLDRLPGRKSEV